MGVFDFNSSKELRTICHYRDDGDIEFQKREIKDGHLVTIENDKITVAHPHYHKLQYPFAGHKNIPADMVTIICDRDIILDPHGIIDDREKPEKGGSLVKTRTAQVADTQRFKNQSKPQSTFLADKMTLFLGAIGVIMALAAGIRAAIK